ncbi:MAG: response regulator [Parashewanella sp.]
MKLLLVEDDLGLVDLLTQLLELEGFHITATTDGEAGLQQALSLDYDLILLDVMLPKLNGFELLRKLRQQKQTPVLMLTARGEDIDKVVGLEIGADDYLAKPFNDRELIARIKAILRRSQVTQQQKKAATVRHQGDLYLDITRQEVLCDNLQIELTGTEFALLNTLIEHCGEMVDREYLSQQVLGKKLMAYDRSLDMHLSNLRKKIPERDDGRPRVKTVRGKGYIWLP